MKNKKTSGIIIAIAGLAILLISIFGYELGVARNPSFGALQITGTILGAVILIYGLVNAFKKN